MSAISFRQFLQEKARQMSPEERDKRRKDWVEAVSRLMAQLSGWLKEADTGGILEMFSGQVESLEEGLGIYWVPKLRVVLGDSEVEILPVARNVVGRIAPTLPSEGRVDITDGARKYPLHRTTQDGQERWYVVNAQREPAVFDRQRFEAIMQELLA